jgi:hypothetical protein
MVVLILIGLAILSGILGRMGGAHGFNTLFRDIGCSVIVVLAVIFLTGWHVNLWWVYLLVFGLHWAAFSTYWDSVYGYDNLFFSGLATGGALLPVLFIAKWLLIVVVIRAVVLAISWHLLNIKLPQKVLIWRRDVAEEFMRYFLSL